MKLAIAAVLLGAAEAAVGDGGRLNTFADPKMSLHSGAEVAGIKNWDDAKDFCWHEAGYRALASHWELCCDAWKEDPNKRNPYVGRKPDSQWMPARAKDKNEWVQVGTTDEAPMCDTYRKANGIPYPKDVIAASAEPWESPCEKPADCTGTKCAMKCTEKAGYYPSPKDCTEYCYCSGKDDMSSFWEKVTGDGLIWDPFCADSDPLDWKNKPLG